MLVFKSLHGLAPAYLLNEFSCMRNFHSTRVTEICSICRYSCSRAKIWNTCMRSEHYLNRFGFGLKRHYLDPSQIEPPVLLLYLVVPLFLSVIVFCVVFSFHRGPISNQPRWTGHPRLNIIQNKINKINQQLQLLIFPKFMQT